MTTTSTSHRPGRQCRDPLPVLRPAVRPDPDGQPRPRRCQRRHRRGPGLPHQPGRPVPEGLDERRGPDQPRPPDQPPGPRGRRRAGPRRAGTTPSTSSPTGCSPSGRESGPDAVAVFGGGGLTNEKAYQLGKFARVALGTANIDYNGRFCMSSAAAAANRSLGVDRGLPFPLTDLAGADAVLLLGSNLAETMPPVGRPPRRTCAVAVGSSSSTRAAAPPPTSRPTARGCTSSRCPAPTWSSSWRCSTCCSPRASPTPDYLERRTTGLEDVTPSLGPVVAGARRAGLRRPGRPPARRGAAAGRSQSRPVAARVRSSSPAAASSSPARAPPRSRRPSTSRSCSACPGRVGSGYGAVTGQGNGQGGREHGQKADQLPGYRMIDDPAARAHVAAVWGVSPESLPGKGMPAVELLASLGTADGPRALLVHGSNLLVSAPNAHRVADRLAALDLLVVCDFVPSETALLADVVLPVTQWAEEEGTMTSLEGRVIRRRKAVEPPAGVRSELWVWAQLAARLGCRRHLGHRAQRGLRRARPGQPRRPRRLQRPQPRTARRRRGAALAVPRHRRRGARPPGHPTPVRRLASRHRTDGPGWWPSTTSVRPTTCAPTPRSTSSPGGCCSTTSPAPRPGGCRLWPAPCPAPSPRCTRCSPRGSASRTASGCGSTTARGSLAVPGAG